MSPRQAARMVLEKRIVGTRCRDRVTLQLERDEICLVGQMDCKPTQVSYVDDSMTAKLDTITYPLMRAGARPCLSQFLVTFPTEAVVDTDSIDRVLCCISHIQVSKAPG